MVFIFEISVKNWSRINFKTAKLFALRGQQKPGRFHNHGAELMLVSYQCYQKVIIGGREQLAKY